MKRFMTQNLLIIAGILMYCQIPVQATPIPTPVILPASVSISSVGVSGGAATLTISTPTSGVGPYSAGYYTYVSHIHIEGYMTASSTASVTPMTCTTTNLQSLAFNFAMNQSTGTLLVIDMPLDNPIQGTIASNVAVSCPAKAGVLWNLILTYFQGQ